MCGIAGVIGKDAVRKCIEILKNLEYRGYDSCGIAYIVDGKLQVDKVIGTPDSLNPKGESNICIGHVRWATHGTVSLENTHPIVYDKLATVHNGMITNYQDFIDGDLDTHVIPRLLSRMSCEDVLDFLHGSLTSLTLREDGTLICMKRGTPLYLGVKKDEEGDTYIFCSDVQSMVKMIDRYTSIPDDVCVVKKPNDKWFFTNFKFTTLEWKDVDKTKIVDEGYKEYETFTLTEIMEQPNTILAPCSNSDEIKRFYRELLECGYVYFIGAGTSYHACLYGKYLFLSDPNEPERDCVQAIPASELISSRVRDGSKVVCISQSGETVDILNTLHDIPVRCDVGSITNNPYSTLAQLSDKHLCLNVGVERSVIATKTFTAQLATLFLLHSYEVNPDKGIKYLVKMSKYLKQILTSDEMNKLFHDSAVLLNSVDKIMTIGHNLGDVVSKEFALKMNEMCYKLCEQIPSGELKHGRISVVDDNTAIVAFVDSSDYRTPLAITQAKSRGAKIVSITCKRDKNVEKNSDIVIQLKDFTLLNPISQTVCLQMILYRLSRMLGINPDKPRNLAKTITVE